MGDGFPSSRNVALTLEERHEDRDTKTATRRPRHKDRDTKTATQRPRHEDRTRSRVRSAWWRDEPGCPCLRSSREAPSIAPVPESAPQNKRTLTDTRATDVTTHEVRRGW
jgi:hypothetical protein